MGSLKGWDVSMGGSQDLGFVFSQLVFPLCSEGLIVHERADEGSGCWPDEGVLLAARLNCVKTNRSSCL